MGADEGPAGRDALLHRSADRLRANGWTCTLEPSSLAATREGPGDTIHLAIDTASGACAVDVDRGPATWTVRCVVDDVLVALDILVEEQDSFTAGSAEGLLARLDAREADAGSGGRTAHDLDRLGVAEDDRWALLDGLESQGWAPEGWRPGDDEGPRQVPVLLRRQGRTGMLLLTVDGPRITLQWDRPAWSAGLRFTPARPDAAVEVLIELQEALASGAGAYGDEVGTVIAEGDVSLRTLTERIEAPEFLVLTEPPAHHRPAVPLTAEQRDPAPGAGAGHRVVEHLRPHGWVLEDWEMMLESGMRCSPPVLVRRGVVGSQGEGGELLLGADPVDRRLTLDWVPGDRSAGDSPPTASWPVGRAVGPHGLSVEVTTDDDFRDALAVLSRVREGLDDDVLRRLRRALPQAKSQSQAQSQ